MQLTSASQKSLGEYLARSQTARAFPRSLEVVRDRLLALSADAAFARLAVYEKEIRGEIVHGLSVRFADDALPIFGNLDVSATQTDETDDQQGWRVTVIDLETNVVTSEELSVRKVRFEDDPTWTGAGRAFKKVALTVDEIRADRLDACARLRRQLVLQRLPAQLKAECLARCLQAAGEADSEHGDDARKLLVGQFEEIGVSLDDLKLYLGHSAKNVTDAELAALRHVYVAIKEGETAWPDVMQRRQAQPKKSRRTTDAIKERTADTRAAEGRRRRTPSPAPTEDGTPAPGAEQAGSASGSSGLAPNAGT